MEKRKEMTFIESLIPVIFLIVFLGMNVIFFDDTLSGSNQIILLLAAALAAVLSKFYGIAWSSVKDRIIKTISDAMPSILILLLIGSLSGTWMISGVIPALVYYGVDILHPNIFLFAAVVISSVVSLATGSSWSTVATIGLALLGVGMALGLNKAVIAGAIISGAYFGDKMSPLSDTTNLAPAMAGTDIFTHIRYMFYTTIPSLTITLVIFFIWGFQTDFHEASTNIEQIQTSLSETFNINPALLLVPVILLVIIARKTPPIPAMLAGTILGGICAVIFQPDIIRHIAGPDKNYFISSYMAFVNSMFGDITIETSNSTMNELLSSSGMAGMLPTVWLIISAMIFGGAMEAGGLLKKITQTQMKFIRSKGSLVSSTAFTCIFFNTTASDQYISIVVPGRMYKEAYKHYDLKPEVLSRTLEDAGTATSVLIPWNTCGATQSTVLGVPTLSYLPYCFFNIISPFMTMTFAYLNIKIRTYNKNNKENKNDNQEYENETA